MVLEKPAECGPTPRSKRIYVYWGVALALLLGLGVFCWLVVVPVMGVHAALEATVEMRRAKQRSVIPADLKPAVERLGEPDRAAGLLCLYLRLPDRLVVYRTLAIEALAVCKKKRAVPLLMEALRHEDEEVRMRAVLALGLLAREAKPAVGQLVSALRDPDELTRMYAAAALGAIDWG